MSAVTKVAVYPCGGVGFVLSSVARYAAYLVTEDLLPGLTEIVDAQRLISGMPDEVALVENHPTILIDGCGYQCGSNLFRMLELKPALRLLIPPIAKMPPTYVCDCKKQQTKISPGTQRRVPSESGKNLASEIAARTASAAQAMLRGNYCYDKQKIRSSETLICRFLENIPREVNYVQLSEGVDRPASMPKINGFE